MIASNPLCRLLLGALLVCAPSACTSSNERAAASPAASAASAAASTATTASAAPAPKEKALPQSCAEPGKKECTPDPAFAKALCEGNYPSVALALFAKGTPFTRAYLLQKTNAWNASGGASSNDELALDEEVLILRAREPATGGIVVSGQGTSYDALRWNGDCVTLSSGEVTQQRASRPRQPRLRWRKLESEMRDVLREDASVAEAERVWRKECKGVDVGAVTKACEVADGKLVEAVAKHVRDGGKLAPPKELP